MDAWSWKASEPDNFSAASVRSTEVCWQLIRYKILDQYVIFLGWLYVVFGTIKSQTENYEKPSESENHMIIFAYY